jgi:hypothetical protein
MDNNLLSKWNRRHASLRLCELDLAKQKVKSSPTDTVDIRDQQVETHVRLA